MIVHPQPHKRYSLLNIWVVSLALKALLSIGYHSTDFDVHRNWLAITHNLPVAKWYVESTSQWTLDYPPFFAYFEWIMAKLVPKFVQADGCLSIVEKGIYGLPTIYFQRISVIVSELALFASLQWCVNTQRSLRETTRAYVVALSLVLSPGLLIVDHIHFQYNGLLYGMLVLMINCARLQKYLWCGFWFAVLLCFKHIYLYLAPAVFVFLLRAHCLNVAYDPRRSFLHNAVSFVKWRNLFQLSAVVLGVFTVAFGPFVYYHVVPDLASRLFPFNRGLTHAYWAPNFWAVYSFADRLLIQVYQRIPIARVPLRKIFHFNASALLKKSLLGSSTRGIVGDVEFHILPAITPHLTFMLTLFYQLMSLIPLFLHPTFERFVGALTLCGYASFLFGWHVHEKAVLIVIFPISFLVPRDKRLLSQYTLLVACGYVSLFPLIFTGQEWLIKVAYTLLWYIIFNFNFRKVVRVPAHLGEYAGYVLERVTNLYILGLIPVVLVTLFFEVFQHKYEVLRKLEFFKLMLISVYCGVGVISSWNGFNWLYFVDESIWDPTGGSLE